MEIALTDEGKKFHRNQEVCHICEKEFCTNKDDEKNFKSYHKIRGHSHYTGKYRGVAHSFCNLQYKIPKEIPIVFHNGSTYDYHFIIEQLTKEFTDGFKCLGENTEKYITFSAPITKKLDDSKEITFRLKFIDSYRFMEALLSSLVDNLLMINKKQLENKLTDSMRSIIGPLLQSIDKVSVIDKKISQIDKKEPENKFTDSMKTMMSSLSQSIDKISEINKKISQIELIEKFPNIHKLCNTDLDRFVLLLRKGVYPYEYMNGWEGFNETLPPKKIFL